MLCCQPLITAQQVSRQVRRWLANVVRGWLRLGLVELTGALLPTTDNSTAGELTGLGVVSRCGIGVVKTRSWIVG